MYPVIELNMSGYKFRANKTSTKKVFLDAIDQRDAMTIHDCLTNKADSLDRKPVPELSKTKLADLWQCVCDVILTLPPTNKKYITSPRCSKGVDQENADGTEIDQEQQQHKLPLDTTARTNIAMQLLKEVFPTIALKYKEPLYLADISLVLSNLIEADLFTKEVAGISEIMWRKKWSGRLLLVKKPLQMILQKIQGETTRADIKCLILYKEALKYSAPWIEELQPLLLKCLCNKSVLAESTCVAFLAHLFTLNIEMLMLCHEEVKNYLTSESVTKQHARTLGKVYAVACFEASDELRQVLKENCMQFYMLHFIRVKWDIAKETMSPLGHILQEFLEEFHSVAKKHPVVLTLLLDAYDPILWRNLNNANSCFRTNASRILLDLFPLERPGALREENEKLLISQYNYMLKMLEDDSHLVRLIAVKEVCRILAHYWECIPQSFKTGASHMIISKLAFDGALSEIRQQALLGLAYALVHGPYSLALFIGQHLPKLKTLIFDESKVVSKAMITMLIALQQVPHPNVGTPVGRVPTCWNVVQPRSIVQLLAAENTKSSMSRLLVELLFASLHPDDPIKLKQRSVVKRVSWLVKTNLQAARNFYENSEHLLPIHNAVRFMQKVLIVLYRNCKKVPGKAKSTSVTREDKENSDYENIPNSQGSEVEVSSQEEEEEDAANNTVNSSTSVSLSDPAVVRGLLEVVFVLWLLHVEELRHPNNEKYNKKLVVIAKDSVVEIYKTWKDNDDVMHPLLLLASMLPNKRVRALVSYSLSQLKCLMKMERPLNKPMAGLMLTALCNWNCGNEVLEMIADCFSCTIQSALPMKTPTPRKNKRVKFEAVGQLNPKVALEFVHILLMHPVNHDYILHKCHTAVCELLLSLQPIQVLALQRLQHGQPLQTISDEMIHKLFQRYVYLIALMKSPVNKPYDVKAKFQQLVLWAIQFLIPFTSEDCMELDTFEAMPLVSFLLMDLCKGVGVALHCMHVSVDFTKSLMEMCQACLNSCAAQYLIPGVLCIMAPLIYQFVCEKQDRRAIIISDVINLSDLMDITHKALLKCSDSNKLHMSLAEDSLEKKVESNIEELLIALCTHYTSESPEISRVAFSFLQAVLQLTEFETRDSDSIWGDVLPFPAEYFLGHLLQSPITSVVIVQQFTRLVFDKFSDRDSGREAVEVVVKTLEESKWKTFLTPAQKLSCRQALEACNAAAIQVDKDQS